MNPKLYKSWSNVVSFPYSQSCHLGKPKDYEHPYKSNVFNILIDESFDKTFTSDYLSLRNIIAIIIGIDHSCSSCMMVIIWPKSESHLYIYKTHLYLLK